MLKVHIVSIAKRRFTPVIDHLDHSFYQERVSSFLPDKILDFHAHIWTADQWLGADQQQNATSNELSSFKTAKYMVTSTQYTIEELKDDYTSIFPDKQCSAVVFGQPTPAVKISKTNEYVKLSSGKNNFPLLVCGGGSVSLDTIYENASKNGFYGYKVFLNWIGNDYGNVTVEDMLLPEEMAIANELELIVLLHVPRSLRLADPEIGKGVRKLAISYPKAKIVLAHCGRCYDPHLMRKAISSVADLKNVYMDTSMVMDAVSITLALREIGYSRLLYATDLPVAAMKGRRVNVKDHWVDLVLNEYTNSDYRVQSNNMNATYMAHEIAIAVEHAADLADLSEHQLKSIFYDNGMDLLSSVKK